MADKISLASNFIQNAIEEDLRNGKYTEGYIPGSRLSQMATFILVMQSPSA